jgi:hypothetical protein
MLVLRSVNKEAGIAQSVQRLATGWTTDGSEFEILLSRVFCFLHVIQIGSGAYPASYPMGMGRSFPGGKVARA